MVSHSCSAFTGRNFLQDILSDRCLPMAGAFIGGIPFFLNNLLTTHNLLIPAFDLPRPLVVSTIENGSTFRGPLQIQEVTNNMDMINQTGALGATETLVRVYDIISFAILRGFSFENIVQGFSGVMLFPRNGNIGFAIMCPLVVLALAAASSGIKKS